jgi:hypothetical protein
MGSWIYAKRCKERGEKIIAMLSLETMGYFSDERGSQVYPLPMNLFYPPRGDFIAFVGDAGSRTLINRVTDSFRRHATIPTEKASLPRLVHQAGWSDHWSFWQMGYPGLMVTDTAPFRYAHYHTPQDTVDKIDFDRLARVVAGLAGVIRDLAK